ncbi:MAG: hypothetical protein AB1481_05790 [Candidatus Omnitrophota bacterium]
MSVIYDALKKVEKAQGKETGADASGNKRSFFLKSTKILLYFSASCVGLILGSIIFGTLSKKPAIAKKIALAKEAIPEAISRVVEKPIPIPQSAPEKEDAPASKEEARIGFSLNGIFFSEGKGFALLNNKVVMEGDYLEGAVVQKINPEDITLLVDGASLTLSTRLK